jgi:hypothetical protein
MTSKLWAGIFALLLAGCTSPSMGGDNNGTGSSTPELKPEVVEANSTPSSPEPEMEAKPLLLSDCSGIVTSYTVPKGLTTANPPAGWGQSESPLVEVWLFVIDCARVSWNGFERPLQLVLEAHGNKAAPDTCENGGIDQSNALAQLWTTDSEFSKALSQRLDLPIETAEITHTESPAGSAWNFSIVNHGQPSRLAAGPRNTPLDHHDVGLHRIFWGNQYRGISYLDFEYDLTRDSLETPIVSGSLAAPFVYAQTGNPIYASEGAAFSHANSSWTVHEFGDLTCQKPS